MIYYTADLHFHYALLLPSRPFATVEEMDEALVKNWNDTVGPEDTVYLVGDIGWNGGRVPGELLERLSGHKHLIRGNHDTGYEDAGRLYRWFETVTDFNEIDDGETHILLCHYPMLYHKRGYMIHGHLHHGRGRDYELLRQLPRPVPVRSGDRHHRLPRSRIPLRRFLRPVPRRIRRTPASAPRHPPR